MPGYFAVVCFGVLAGGDLTKSLMLGALALIAADDDFSFTPLSTAFSGALSFTTGSANTDDVSSIAINALINLIF
jgi:hypothetical protein